MNVLVDAVNKSAPSVLKAKAALAVMERELGAAKTYKEIRRIERAAEAMKILFGHVEEVRRECEIVILIANQRIAQETEAIPNAPRGKSSSKSPRKGNLGRTATGIPHQRRSRQKKLIPLSKTELKAVAEEIQNDGKEATLTAVVRALKDVEIKDRRKDYEARADKGARLADLVALGEAGQKFAVIYADPPWEFKVYSGKGKQRSAERHYDVSSLDAIKKLPVAPLAAQDCALFLWCVWPELPGALEVIKAWGFEYKTAGFLWAKQNRSGEGWFTGMGYWTRANTEVCLLATKGSPQRMALDVPQLLVAPVGEHSVKPDDLRKRIERLLIGPYLELFARESADGWVTWGNEIQMDQAAE